MSQFFLSETIEMFIFVVIMDIIFLCIFKSWRDHVEHFT